MERQADATKDELFDAALDALECQDGKARKAVRWGLEEIVRSIENDLKDISERSRTDVADRLAKLARAAKTASRILRDSDVRRVLELHIRATTLSRILPNALPRHLRTLANTASKAAADPELHGGGKDRLEDVFDLPAKTKLAALVDPVFTHVRGKQGAANEDSDLDVLLSHLWEVISGDKADQSFEQHIRQARAKRGRNTNRRLAALVTARLEARDILDGILEKLNR